MAASITSLAGGPVKLGRARLVTTHIGRVSGHLAETSLTTRGGAAP